ncbi:MAG: molybdopterin-dependent oxidoreductase, partial [Candidatus Eisenbacteria bacterium]|nr:molybdopterin-dependent oxidoreductase [Candidatus Eisenbacteria bacterium]
MASILGRRFGPYLEIFKTLWANRRSPLYALRILRHGVCDGCALGTSGLKDWTMSGVHLCWIRLNLLHLNTMKSFEPSPLSNLDSLKGKTEKELRMLGRVQSPLVRRRGEPGFTPVSWEEAEDLIADKISKTEPKRSAFYLVSRGTTNETYYATQKVARFLGTNHVDNSARICHSPSTTGLKTTIGFAATTCSYKDLIGSDLVVFIGSDAANNQPVLMKYMHLAKEAGTKVLSINPYREPGLEKYWVPSSVRSAVLGTEIVEQHFPIKVGGDIAFLNGTMKVLHERGALNDRFIAERTSGWDEVQEELKQSSFKELETASGVPQATMESFADYLEQANSAVFVWSMGITMHRHGVANVQTIANLALALGFVGKPKCGLMPIRGHSGVQGGAEMGCVPNTFPGGAAVGSESAKNLSRHWNFEVPDWPGSYAVDMINQAEKGDLDFLYCVGSNLLDVLPDRAFVRRALENISLRVHHDIVLNRQMFVEPKDTVLILPATTRYEMEGGNTETST